MWRLWWRPTPMDDEQDKMMMLQPWHAFCMYSYCSQVFCLWKHSLVLVYLSEPNSLSTRWCFMASDYIMLLVVLEMSSWTEFETEKKTRVWVLMCCHMSFTIFFLNLEHITYIHTYIFCESHGHVLCCYCCRIPVCVCKT